MAIGVSQVVKKKFAKLLKKYKFYEHKQKATIKLVIGYTEESFVDDPYIKVKFRMSLKAMSLSGKVLSEVAVSHKFSGGKSAIMKKKSKYTLKVLNALLKKTASKL